MNILTDSEADLAWYFSPKNPDHCGSIDSRHRIRLTEKEICLLEAQEKKTIDWLKGVLKFEIHDLK